MVSRRSTPDCKHSSDGASRGVVVTGQDTEYAHVIHLCDQAKLGSAAGAVAGVAGCADGAPHPTGNASTRCVRADAVDQGLARVSYKIG